MREALHHQPQDWEALNYLGVLTLRYNKLPVHNERSLTTTLFQGEYQQH